MRRQRGPEVADPAQRFPVLPVPTHGALYLGAALDAHQRRNGLNRVVPTHFQLAVIHDIDSRRKRRVVLGIDGEPAAGGLELPKHRFDQRAGWAIALDDGDQSVGQRGFVGGGRHDLKRLLTTASPPLTSIWSDATTDGSHPLGACDLAERVLHPRPMDSGRAPSNALASRFQQMFPVLSPAEIERVRHFGEVRRFLPGEALFQAGKPVPGMYVILSGRVAVAGRDAVGQALPVAAFAEMMSATLEDLAEVVPGEVLAEIGALSGQPSVRVIDAQAVGGVEAIDVPPERLRALLIAEAELGERILRALILRRVDLIEMGFGGPVLVGSVKSPEVTRLSVLLGRTGIPFRVIDPDQDADASSLLARFAPNPGELPIVVIPDGTVLKNPTKQDLARALGLVATTLRSDPYDVAIVGAGPAGLATAVYGASEGLSILVLEALTYGGQAGASARIENYLGFPTGVSGQALMSLAFTQAQKFGAEFSLSTEVKRLDCTSEISGPDPVHILHLADSRQIRARAVVVATGARYRRPEIPNLPQFQRLWVSSWASPAHARLCRPR